MEDEVHRKSISFDEQSLQQLSVFQFAAAPTARAVVICLASYAD